MRERYDVIVIGGGHAGTEAAWAASAVLGKQSRVALVTMDPSRIGQMSCNPAIGGLGKGQIVREIDALGGLMGRAIDAAGIMFKMLNTSKGAAVHGPRAQADKYGYACEIQRLVSTRYNIDVIAGTADDIIIEEGRVVGVVIPAGAGVVHADPNAIKWNASSEGPAHPVYPAKPLASSRSSTPLTLRTKAIVLTTGTFMRGLMHTGEQKTEGGRVGEGSAKGVSGTLRKLGFELGRLKTGTPPRLVKESLDWDALERQIGDKEPVPFSDLTHIGRIGDDSIRFPRLPQIECRITHTTAQAHELIRANLHRAPMFSGQVEAECGPRYCPSIEDKIVRFADRDSHHVFLEPESLHTNEVYCNGISTSLPIDVQQQLVHAMPGCEHAAILKWGYAVEYDMVWPHQIDATCMAKHARGLFLAGQINCTTGYEEAAGQGLIAGVNAARLVTSCELVRLARDEGYIGVMMDDLVTKTPREPYRMFTSRAEHRLRLRADNADERLTPLGRELGLIGDEQWSVYEQRRRAMEAIREACDQIYIGGKSLRELARRPHVTAHDLLSHLRANNGHGHDVDVGLVERVMIDAKYEGYIARQHAEVKRQKNADSQHIPGWLDYRLIRGLRTEAAEVLERFRPRTIGQASRLAGVNPADITLITVAIRAAKTSKRLNV